MSGKNPFLRKVLLKDCNQKISAIIGWFLRMADIWQAVHRDSWFISCLNWTFPWRNTSSVKTMIQWEQGLQVQIFSLQFNQPTKAFTEHLLQGNISLRNLWYIQISWLLSWRRSTFNETNAIGGPWLNRSTILQFFSTLCGVDYDITIVPARHRHYYYSISWTERGILIDQW